MSIRRTRQQALIRELNGGLVVITAYIEVQQSGDMSAPFLQEGNFWWLSGIEEPGWRIIIDGKRGRTTLVAPARNQMVRLFDGSLDYEQALKFSGADEVINSEDFEPFVKGLARNHALVLTVYDRTPYHFFVNPAQRDLHSLLERTFTSVQSCEHQLKKLRAIKQPEEISAITKAVKLTTVGFEKVRKSLAEMSYEYEIEARFDYEFRRVGASHAYAPIVAAGTNACTLHYGRNNSKLKKGQVVLIDIGARIDGYAADITRTYAIGTPTKRQIDVHQAVESARKQIIAMIKPLLAVDEYQRQVEIIMIETLRKLGLYKDEESLRMYFPHAISHGLGIDVHDSLGAPKYFKENMVLTIEPGIYIPEERIGVRIEDDVLVTAKGHQNLSGSLSTEL